MSAVQTVFPERITGKVVNIIEARRIMKQLTPGATTNIWPLKIDSYLEIDCDDGSIFLDVPIDWGANSHNLQDQRVGLSYDHERHFYTIDAEGV